MANNERLHELKYYVPVLAHGEFKLESVSLHVSCNQFTIIIMHIIIMLYLNNEARDRPKT